MHRQHGSEGLFTIGRIVGAHGLRGALKVLSYAESLDVFKADKALRIRNQQGHESIHTLQWIKPFKRGALVSLEGIETREQAQELVGAALLMDRAELPALGDDIYYWADLIGLRVYDDNGTELGVVAHIIPTGSNDVYVVKSSDGEILIPALASVIQIVDLENKTMRVILPEGL